MEPSGASLFDFCTSLIVLSALPYVLNYVSVYAAGRSAIVRTTRRRRRPCALFKGRVHICSHINSDIL